MHNFGHHSSLGGGTMHCCFENKDCLRECSIEDLWVVACITSIDKPFVEAW